MLNCHDATRLMSESQERPLSLSEKVPLKFHTMMCAGCRNFGEQMGALRVMTRAYAKGKNEQETTMPVCQKSRELNGYSGN